MTAALVALEVEVIATATELEEAFEVLAAAVELEDLLADGAAGAADEVAFDVDDVDIVIMEDMVIEVGAALPLEAAAVAAGRLRETPAEAHKT